jgi:hypothetical protein
MATGDFISQISHTRLEDREGYNPLLNNGADRWLDRTYLLMQYRRRLSTDTTLLFNFFHQYQRSNIELFDSTDTTIEVGISLAL